MATYAAPAAHETAQRATRRTELRLGGGAAQTTVGSGAADFAAGRLVRASGMGRVLLSFKLESPAHPCFLSADVLHRQLPASIGRSQSVGVVGGCMVTAMTGRRRKLVGLILAMVVAPVTVNLLVTTPASASGPTCDTRSNHQIGQSTATGGAQPFAIEGASASIKDGGNYVLCTTDHSSASNFSAIWVMAQNSNG